MLAMKSRTILAPIIASPATTPQYSTILLPSTLGVVVTIISLPPFHILPTTSPADRLFLSRRKTCRVFSRWYPQIGGNSGKIFLFVLEQGCRTMVFRASPRRLHHFPFNL